MVCSHIMKFGPSPILAPILFCIRIHRHSEFLSVCRGLWLTDLFALKFYSRTQNYISPSIGVGLNFVTCEQIFTVPYCNVIFLILLSCRCTSMRCCVFDIR